MKLAPLFEKRLRGIVAHAMINKIPLKPFFVRQYGDAGRRMVDAHNGLPGFRMRLIPKLIPGIPKPVVVPAHLRGDLGRWDIELLVPPDLLVRHLPFLPRERACPLPGLDF